MITNRHTAETALNQIASSDPGKLMIAGQTRLTDRGFPRSFLLDITCEGAYEILKKVNLFLFSFVSFPPN